MAVGKSSLPLLAAGLATLLAAPAMADADTRLLAAVQSQDHATLKALLAKHVNPNARLLDKSTVLEWAVDREDEEGVRMLLAAGASANIVDDQGSTPLLVACELGNDAIIKQLLDAHADVKAMRWDGIGVSALCAGSASMETLKRIITLGAPLDVADPAGQTPLMFAAASARIDNVAFLLSQGAKVNAASSRGGFTPLFFAVKTGSAPLVQMLLKAGANVNYVAPDGTRAIHLAMYVNDTVMATLLIQQGAELNNWDELGKQPLDAAVANRDVDLVKLMLSKGADPNALTRLAYRIDPVLASEDPAGAAEGKKLSAEGAKAQLSTRGFAQTVGYTPKFMLNHVEGVGLQPPPAPTTALLLAAETGLPDMMKMMIDAGGKPDVVTEDGTDLVLAASASGNLEAVKYAVSLHPNVKGAKTDGSTAMHVAVGNSKAKDALAIVQFLADQGAVLDSKNKRGQTPSDVANRGTAEMKALYGSILKAHNITPAPPQARAS